MSNVTITSPRESIHYTNEELELINSIKNQINNTIHKKNQESQKQPSNGIWMFIAIEINGILAEKIAKTIVYHLENKHWKHPSYEYRHKEKCQCTIFTFENPLAYDIL